MIHPCCIASRMQIAAASALANWSRILLDESRGVSELGPREDALRAIISRFGDEHETDFAGYSQVALLRFLQAIATFMWGDATVIRVRVNSGHCQLHWDCS